LAAGLEIEDLGPGTARVVGCDPALPQDGIAALATDVLDVLAGEDRSEEHTSELQSRGHLVCRPLLEKKKVARLYRCGRTLSSCGARLMTLANFGCELWLLADCAWHTLAQRRSLRAGLSEAVVVFADQ